MHHFKFIPFLSNFHTAPRARSRVIHFEARQKREKRRAVLPTRCCIPPVPGESGLPSSESDPLPLSTLVCVRILESGYGGRRKKRGSTNAVGICGERLFLWWGMDSRLKLKVGYQRSFTSDDLNGGDLIAASPQQQTLSRLTITGEARSSTLSESSVSDIDRRKEEPLVHDLDHLREWIRIR